MKRLVENMPRVSLAWWKQKNGVDYEVTVTAVHMACIADGPLRSRVQIRAWRLVGTRSQLSGCSLRAEKRIVHA